MARAFASVADVYERARPSYPDEAVAHLARELDLRAGRTVLDLGAGTGKLTRLLVPTGARVIAVEPIDEMRAVLERAAPEAEALGGTAEQIPLAGATVDAVTAAQAFHWFDHERALAEIHRVLRRSRTIGLIWNSRDLDDPLQERLEELLQSYRQVAPQQLDGKWRAAVDASPLFGAIHQLSVPWAHEITRDGLVDRVASTSVVAALPEAERAALLERVRSVVADEDEPFAFRYRTDVFVFRAVD